jgi:hypothetical protein
VTEKTWNTAQTYLFLKKEKKYEILLGLKFDLCSLNTTSYEDVGTNGVQLHYFLQLQHWEEEGSTAG